VGQMPWGHIRIILDKINNLIFNKMNNLILMGPPGAGKTTIGKILSKRLNLPVIDIDDDCLETAWKCSVGDKLAELGDEKFLQLEGETTMKLNIKNHIISISGSSPLHKGGMDHLRSLGTVIYLDVPTEVIIKRLHEMKVDRIVGMKKESLADILKYRLQFYNNSYDLRVTFYTYHTPSEMVDRILKEINKSQLYISTRGWKQDNFNFQNAIKQGLAPDGGLFVPQYLPSLHKEEIMTWKHMSYQKKALRVMEKFPLGSLCPQTLKKLINKAYKKFAGPQICPLKHLHEKHYLLELWHGPTAAFKDIALQLMPKFFSHAIQEKKDNKQYLILAATSGDTGIAAMEGLKNEKNIKIIVLYPKNGVSDTQKQQMITQDSKNIMAIGVEADFDYCQATVKTIFKDEQLRQLFINQHNTYLSSANSINWGRILPQIIYYITAYMDLINEKQIMLGDFVEVCVPSGNFGNILSALYAREMGVPINRFICASNSNNVLSEFINTGTYDLRNKKLIQTSAPSIDILKSSNIERLLYFLSDNDSSLVKSCMQNLEKNKWFTLPPNLITKLKTLFVADFCSEEESLQTIKDTYEQTKELLDPHTAVAKHVADRFKSKHPVIITSTAHWSKFGSTVLSALKGNLTNKDMKTVIKEIQKIAPKVDIHPKIDQIWNKPIKQTTTVSANYDELIKIIESFISN
jgi:threonine synthase